MMRWIKILLVSILALCLWGTFQAWTFRRAASNSVIWIDPGNSLFSITARENPSLLFDADRGQKMDEDEQINFASPNEFFIELKDSTYNHMRVRFYNETGAAQIWTVIFYDSNRVARGSYSFDGVAFPYQGWYTLPGTPDTISVPIKYLFFSTTNAASDVRQIEITGDRVAYSPSFRSYLASVIRKPIVDPGRRFIGGSSLPGKDTNYMKLADGRHLFGSWRFAGGNTWQYNRDETATWTAQPNIPNTEGDIYTVGGMKFHYDGGEHVQFYLNSPSIKADPTGTLTKSTPYITMANALNFYKDIPKGSDSTDPANWFNQGRVWAFWASEYGRNPTADTAGLLIRNDGVHAASNLIVGKGGTHTCEIGNENDKYWGGVTAYHSPRVTWAHLKVAYEAIKLRDPSMQVYLGATIQIDTNYWKALVFLDFWKTGVRNNFPADGLCFNQYHSTTYGGQPNSDTYSAITPERFRMDKRLDSVDKFRNRWLPNRGIRYTELGYSISGGPYDVVSLPGMPDSVVVAALQIRAYELGSMSFGIEALFNYKQQSDGSSNFAGMYLVRERFHPTLGHYIGSDRLPAWWAIATRMNTLYDYKAYARTLQHGDSTGVYAVMRDHTTDNYKKVVSLWRGTYNGSTTTNYKLKLGRIVSAKWRTYAFGDEDGVDTNLTISAAGEVTIPSVTEMPGYLIVEYKHAPHPYYRNGLKLKRG